MTTQAGTGLFCSVRFISRFLRDVFFLAAMYDRRIPFFRFLSVGVTVRSAGPVAVLIINEPRIGRRNV
jgi:hypothetical protein